jgi:glycosyltransferase involved in cell wall biosynthesis
MGGPAHQASLLSGRRLDPARYETLLIHGSVPPGEESLAELAQEEGASTEFVEELGRPVSPFDDLRALARLRTIARRFRPHLVHTHTAKAGFLGRVVALSLRPRPAVVHTYHGHVLEGYFTPPVNRAYRSLEAFLSRFSDSLIGVSDATVDDLVRLRVAPRERFQIVPLGLDLDPFAQVSDRDGQGLRAQLGLGGDDLVCTYVGRLVTIKRLDVLIGGFARAREVDQRLRLVIVGDGELRPSLERMVNRLGVTSAVTFLGYRRDLPPIIAATDIAVLTSASEGTPVSLIEAGAAGRPAVASAVGGVPEVVIPETGLLFPPGDERALGRALLRMADDSQLRVEMGRRARDHVLVRYSVARLVADIDALYQDLLGATDQSPSGA